MATVLVWGIKDSLVTYVRSMSDGVVEAEAPAVEQSGSGSFVFPAANTSAELCEGQAELRRFAGAVEFLGHGGLLRLRIADPALETDASGRILTIADPYAPGERLVFARVVNGEPNGGERSLAGGLELTADGADLFMSGPYAEGTPLDAFEVRTSGEEPA